MRKALWNLRIIVGVLLCLLPLTGMVFTGCSQITLGREFPSEKVTSIRIGQSSQAEIRELFGSPWRTGVEDGMITWTFGYYYYSPSGDGHASDLVVKFNSSSIVRSYSFNTTDSGE